MRASTLTAILIASLATAGFSAEKARKPRLDLRAAPRMAFSPVNVLLTAELMGGEEVDQLYCPEIEWNWDDGGKSVHESDCAPLESGGTFERRFTAQHAFRQAGTYNVKVTMRKASRPVAVATVKAVRRAAAFTDQDWAGGRPRRPAIGTSSALVRTPGAGPAAPFRAGRRHSAAYKLPASSPTRMGRRRPLSPSGVTRLATSPVPGVRQDLHDARVGQGALLRPSARARCRPQPLLHDREAQATNIARRGREPRAGHGPAVSEQPPVRLPAASRSLRRSGHARVDGGWRGGGGLPTRLLGVPDRPRRSGFPRLADTSASSARAPCAAASQEGGRLLLLHWRAPQPAL
jgi:hypothetical protein